MTTSRVAIVGAGLSGLVCATALKATPAAVTVFDMSTRGPGICLIIFKLQYIIVLWLTRIE
jgi:2-polyprenyl-6-methoxyphenol hydroxylase-like FAD-dependent oxidoreductase